MGVLWQGRGLDSDVGKNFLAELAADGRNDNGRLAKRVGPSLPRALRRSGPSRKAGYIRAICT